MPLEKSQLSIPVATSYGATTLHIVAMSRSKLYEKEPGDGDELELHQLVEGGTYEYIFDDVDGRKFQFEAEDGIIRFSRFSNQSSRGTINTGIYVGQYHPRVRELNSDEIVGEVKLEIRSVKTDYTSDYRMMLSDIAEEYTELVLEQGSPVTQRLEVNDKTAPQTLYQRFCFVRGIIESDAFQEAMHKIMSAPVKKWADSTAYRSITEMRRLSRKNIREIASSTDRIPWNHNNELSSRKGGRGYSDGLTSLPRRLQYESQEESVDNAANQFVKFALRQFEMFCYDLYCTKNATDRLKNEVSATREQINNYLDSAFFRVVSDPTHLALNSPVLQRKEGYREVFQKWLLFDLAAKLNWEGGEDVYEAGKKNVATLYEYWLFLKLKNLISGFFDIDPISKEKLVKTDENGINLNLRQGRMTVIRGVSNSGIRKLNVAFYYNRTFSHVADEKVSLHKAGSWTMEMRPDYTLSLWPGDMTEETAERLDVITHIHFDAKYRLNKVLLDWNSQQEFSAESQDKDNLNETKEQEELGIYKRADLLKMHAYKDAIRRTSGAYVLYPGTENRTIKGFHEILPGLGAFHVRPGCWDNDSEYLRKFLSEVKAHMLDRTSEREKMSYFRYDILKEPNPYTTRRRLPELDEQNRDFLPDEVSVIVGYIKTPAHLDWILKNGLYTMRAGNARGSMSLSPDLINARYLLLHDGVSCQRLMKINPKQGGPKVRTFADLKQNLQYPTEGDDDDPTRIYLVYSLTEAEEEMSSYSWTPDRKWGKKPKPVMLSDLMLMAHVER